MDELIDIVDESGVLTGEVCLKSKAHRFGYWHLCVDIWLYTRSGDLLIQKRIDHKDTFPGLWDVSVAGHVGAGEALIDAAHRELQEELGVHIPHKDLSFIGNYKSDFKHHKYLTDKEFHHIYIAQFKGDISDITLQADEVSEIRLIPINQLKKKVIDTAFKQEFVPYSNAYFSMVFEAIERKCS